MARPSLREKIVDAALDRFHAQGFSACSVQDITDAAGAPKGSFYNHFKTKESLAVAALERYLEDSRVPEHLFAPGKPPLQRLREHFVFLADRQADSGYERGCMIGKFALDMGGDDHPGMGAALGAAMRGWDEAVATVIGEAQAQGAIDSAKDPSLLARYAVNSFEGAMLRARVEKSRAPIEDFLAVAFGMVLN